MRHMFTMGKGKLRQKEDENHSNNKKSHQERSANLNCKYHINPNRIGSGKSDFRRHN